MNLGLVSYNRGFAYDGYTLFGPQCGKEIYLIDMLGNVVHQWVLPYRPADYGYLLEDSHLLFGGRTGN